MQMVDGVLIQIRTQDIVSTQDLACHAFIVEVQAHQHPAEVICAMGQFVTYQSHQCPH